MDKNGDGVLSFEAPREPTSILVDGTGSFIDLKVKNGVELANGNIVFAGINVNDDPTTTLNTNIQFKHMPMDTTPYRVSIDNNGKLFQSKIEGIVLYADNCQSNVLMPTSSMSFGNVWVGTAYCAQRLHNHILEFDTFIVPQSGFYKFSISALCSPMTSMSTHSLTLARDGNIHERTFAKQLSSESNGSFISYMFFPCKQNDVISFYTSGNITGVTAHVPNDPLSCAQSRTYLMVELQSVYCNNTVIVGY